jgi:uncharacterized protein (DUF1697 family)
MAGTMIALIRGINVGKAKRVAMADLRALVESLGCTDVRTLLNSGNVVFTAPAGLSADDAGTRISEGMAQKLGVPARVMVITARELAEIVAGNPLPQAEAEPSRFLVAVLASIADRARLEPLTKEEWAPDALALGTRVAYLWCAGGILESKLVDAVGRATRDAATTRNWATIVKLHALANPSPG